jgi:hypothetical protein
MDPRPPVRQRQRTDRVSLGHSVASRFGLPSSFHLRPRPNVGYADAGAKAMQGI